MKKIYFYDLLFVRHDQNAPSEAKFRRIMAGDKVFYTYSKQFSDTQVLNRLVSGDRVYIGAHQLADGSYWLHWLVSPEKGSLQPNTVNFNKSAAALKLLGAIMVMVSSAWGYLQLPNIWVMLLLFFVFIFGCWWLVSSLHSLLVGIGSSTRRLLQGLEKINNGDASICHVPTALLTGAGLSTRNKPDNDLDSLLPHDFLLADKVALTSVSGEASGVSAHRDSIGSGRSQQYFVEYQFICNGMKLSFRSGFNTLTEDLNPLFYRQHPFFLAAGDPVTAVVNQQDNSVIGLCNERDGRAYLKVGGLAVSSHQLKLMYQLIFGICSFFMVLMVCFTLHDWWEQGGMPDQWDWLYAAGLFYDFGLMSLLIFCVLMLVMEISCWLIRRNSLGAARFVFARQMLMLFKKRSGDNPYIQEVP